MKLMRTKLVQIFGSPYIFAYISNLSVFRNERSIGLPGLAVHWEAEIVFWSDMRLGHIMYSRLDGRYHAFLITGLVKPKALAVDPVEGLVKISS